MYLGKQRYAGILQYFRQFFFTTHVHRVPEPCGFLTQKTTLIFFGPPKFLSCFRFYQKKKTNLKFLIGLLFLLAILYNLTRLPQMPSSIHFVVTFWSTTSTRLNVETCKLMVVRDFTIECDLWACPDAAIQEGRKVKKSAILKECSTSEPLRTF